MANTDRKRERPLSPHLQIYKPQLTSVMSIFHRICGYALAVGTMMVMWLLVAAAYGPEAYDQFMSFSRSWIGLLMIFGWSVALFYHMSNGIRHFCWDLGYLFKLEDAYRAGYLVIASTIILTVVTWWFACPFRDGG